jgi:hypothetical protein
VEERPVTFRLEDEGQRRESREEFFLEWIRRANRDTRVALLLVPFHRYQDPKTAIFHAGWTLVEREGEILTHQCVVYLAGEAVQLGRADQGVVCVANQKSLSAWNGMTDEQTRLRAA